ncbi:MAG: asparagine synthase C-terminal domain-containing protein [Candidatus Thermoplasmatota archaeon]|jgi:asparagine synthase (glutamine-hydrolysing)|nr:asparagine synthase C-terminal domain-containing protein [Candidatus Thermoplasmatota archaeon]
MEWENELEEALEKSIRDVPDRVGVLFSGGLDSSFLAYLLKREGKGVRLYCSGTIGSHDHEWTPKAAEILGLPLEFLSIKEEEIIEGIRNIKRLTGETSSLLLLIELPLYFIAKESTDSVLVTGQGADELFLGYKKYETKDTSREDFQRVMSHIVPLERKIAGSYGKELVYPYLHEKVVEASSKILRHQNITDGTRKYSLRSIASKLGLEREMAWRQKRASQYSSGFKKASEKIAKRDHKTVHEFISEL